LSQISRYLSLQTKSQFPEVTRFSPFDRPWSRGSIKPLTLSRFHIAHPRWGTRQTRNGRVGRKIAEFCQWPLGHGSIESGERPR